jgi:ketosteroid isomerase-like protein
MAEQLLRAPVRFPAKTRKRRTLVESIGARVPGLTAAPTALIFRLSPGSRLRRALILWWVRASYEVVDRRDFDLALMAQDPDTRISWIADASDPIPADLVGEEFRGHDGFRRIWEIWLEAFDDLRLEPEEVSDLGDNRLLIRYLSAGRGTLSGVPAAQHGFTIYSFKRGKVVRQEFFVDRERAERAAGLA